VVAVMVARGDLGVEIGFERMAEITISVAASGYDTAFGALLSLVLESDS